MHKMLRTMLTIVVLLSVFSVSAYATPPTSVAGLLQYTAHFVDMRVADSNTFITTTEDATFTGSFEGTSTDVCDVVIHASGAWFYKASATFVGSVQGREGTLKMLLIGTRPDASSEWGGTWQITGGTGELASLHGHGTFWGPGVPDFEIQGDIYYSGQVHFDPN